MKAVKLTRYETQVIMDALNVHDICRCHCYCDYKTDMCNKYDDDGNYRCKLKKTISSIEEKLGFEW